MKKLIKSNAAFLALLVMLLVSAVPAKAQNCSSAVDKLCGVFNKMAQDVNSVQTMEAFENLDFDKTINASGIENLPDACLAYRLTTIDKDKINKAFDNFYNAVVNKTYSLTGGAVSKSDLSNMMKPMRDTFRNEVRKSTTLGQLGQNMSNAF